MKLAVLINCAILIMGVVLVDLLFGNWVSYGSSYLSKESPAYQLVLTDAWILILSCEDFCVDYICTLILSHVILCQLIFLLHPLNFSSKLHIC